MSSPVIPVRRRRLESGVDDDEDSEPNIRRRGSTRTAYDSSSSPAASPEPVLPDDYRSHPRNRRAAHPHSDAESSDDNVTEGQHQSGAIVRVKVVNFVTYEDAVFYPGPHLNMVIGPNGTGKSSLVCAICLGLGYGPVHLGRAGKVGEFVKHGNDDATIEIELQKRQEDVTNPVVRLRITRDGDKRKWWLNDTETSLRNVQALTKEFGIQVDNLCQFLPQDRVAEFAGLNPVELLHHTQRAAAPEEMLVWHDNLKGLRKEEKALQSHLSRDQEALTNSMQRQDGLRADVERLQERAQVQTKISLLEKTLPFVEYQQARLEYQGAKARRDDARHRLQDLEQQVRPAMEEVNAKEYYQSQIDSVLRERKAVKKEAERTADLTLKRIEETNENITQKEQARKAEFDVDKKRKQDFQKIQTKIRNLEAELLNVPPEFNSEDWNRRIRAKEHRVREIETEERETVSRDQELQQQARPIRAQIERAKASLAALDSQAGKQFNKLNQMSPDTAKAWDWIQKNRDKFDSTVYGPPIVECSIKDPRYLDQIESLFQKGTLLAITTQTKKDYLTLQDILYNQLNLADVQINCASQSLEQSRRFQMPAVSELQLQQFGLDCWALDLIDGPEAVLSMLCLAARIHATGISLKESTEAQFAMLVNSPISNFVTGRHSFSTSRRREYGPKAVSTITKNIRIARNWTDQPVDAAEKRELQANIDGWTEEMEAMKAQVLPIREKMKTLREEAKVVRKEVDDLKREKHKLQTAFGLHNALPEKILLEQDNLEQKRQQGNEFRKRLQQLSVEYDKIILKRTAVALEHKSDVAILRTCRDDCLEAEIRLLEATSDVEALKQRNILITQQLADERRLETEATAELSRAKDAARKALDVCKVILDEDEENREYYNSVSIETVTLQDLERDIDAERAKLDFMHAGNAGALKEFETRQISIDKLEEKIAESSKKLEKVSLKITDLRQKWEPDLDKLVKEISDAFAYNFEQINCAGEVGVHKDEDFDLWAIEIKVKFRENETLQLLDQHRQSGGERAVSTIFYLMALQSLARAPFRVVDEINQGMDPRNERMVHERMVEIACREHTSQYFLITPKLLPNLRYHPRMTVLCIASGEYMPADYRQLDVGRAIQMRRAMAAS